MMDGEGLAFGIDHTVTKLRGNFHIFVVVIWKAFHHFEKGKCVRSEMFIEISSTKSVRDQ